MTAEVLTVKDRPMPLDLLLFKRFKCEIPGFVEAAYAANPGLADLGPILPIGTEVTVALPTPATAVKQAPFVDLFA